MRRLTAQHRPNEVAVDLSAVPDLEYTALLALDAGERRLGVEGVPLHLVGLAPEVLEVVRRSGLGERLGRARMHFNLEQVVAQYRATPG
jgi:anti-anti-sigma regulatory factor